MTSLMEMEQDRLPNECVEAMLMLVNRDSGLPLPRRIFQYNQPIVAEGQKGSSMYLLLRGEVLVERRGTAIALLADKGAFFGEIAALYEGVLRTATVRSRVGGVEVLELSTRDIAGLVLVTQKPIIMATEIISRVAVSRIRTMSEEDMWRSNIPPRSQWSHTEDGEFPPLKIVPANKFRLVP